MDLRGKEVIRLKFENVGRFSFGLAAVFLNGKIGYIDKLGNFVIKPIFDETAGGRWSDFEGVGR
ncbi:MAG: WG repeat-containing protein [Acidobacteriota bacterium]